MQHCNSNLEQVEDLLAQVQLKVCVVGACHVVDEHQAIPLGLKAVSKQKLGLLSQRFGYLNQTGQVTTNLCKFFSPLLQIDIGSCKCYVTLTTSNTV